MAHAAAWPIFTAELGLTRYLEELGQLPMLQQQEAYLLAKRWREHGDCEAAHRLVTSHLLFVAKITMGYRGYGLPISEVVSEGNVGLMKAVKRFEPEKGFRLATYAPWWIKATIQEYILPSWSLVKMGTANQKKVFYNLRKAKSKISALDEGDLRPDQVKLIARQLGVTQTDVIDMTADAAATPRSTRPSARMAIRANGRTGWLTRVPSRKASWPRATNGTSGARCSPRRSPRSMIANGASSKHAGLLKSRSRSRSLPASSACHANACGRSRFARSRRCRRRSRTASP
jgi:RNA polymerase sigma factor (sigma-70 family)